MSTIISDIFTPQQARRALNLLHLTLNEEWSQEARDAAEKARKSGAGASPPAAFKAERPPSVPQNIWNMLSSKGKIRMAQKLQKRMAPQKAGGSIGGGGGSSRGGAAGNVGDIIAKIKGKSEGKT